MAIIIHWCLSAASLLVAAYLLPGVSVGNFFIALVVAVVLGFVNLFIKPLLFLLTLPLTIFTLGLFSLFLNAGLIYLVSAIVPGFHIDSFLWALAFSLVLSLVNVVIKSFKIRNNLI